MRLLIPLAPADDELRVRQFRYDSPGHRPSAAWPQLDDGDHRQANNRLPSVDSGRSIGTCCPMLANLHN
jgi:hypothetical protein